MKEKLFKYFTANNTRRYFDIFDSMISHYNNTRQSSIRMTPVEASRKENEIAVRSTVNAGVFIQRSRRLCSKSVTK
jgi:hypothetical protein